MGIVSPGCKRLLGLERSIAFAQQHAYFGIKVRDRQIRNAIAVEISYRE